MTERSSVDFEHWRGFAVFWQTHPMGETDELKKTVLAQASEDAMVAHTMGGRMHVRSDDSSQARPNGQIVFFAEFLATADGLGLHRHHLRTT